MVNFNDKSDIGTDKYGKRKVGIFLNLILLTFFKKTLTPEVSDFSVD